LPAEEAKVLVYNKTVCHIWIGDHFARMLCFSFIFKLLYFTNQSDIHVFVHSFSVEQIPLVVIA
jgi:hypothetical protein